MLTKINKTPRSNDLSGFVFQKKHKNQHDIHVAENVNHLYKIIEPQNESRQQGAKNRYDSTWNATFFGESDQKKEKVATL